MEKFKILALSGSLRKASYNSAAINAMKVLAPSNVEIVIGEIGCLPLFNPDRESENIPSLEKLRASLNESSGLILASPEYAHGISGPLKNALDWLVSGIEFPYKPIMLINTSPRATYAQEHLREVLGTMSGNIIESAYVSIPLLSSGLGCDGIIEDRGIAGALLAGLSQFCSEIEDQ
ncbi:NADPH-dependent FMN reductase [Marinobacterium sedimentorum]|uniref:NADPH-dependent FMN reductase n=1 Tax=Marinobacterium sedimentorum TaxID=2927804 RepID=UPI0020C6DC3A|nr:NADPH-dependent FMN reductase [Marinobacterium sedimentorum]MCP8687303.1 NAD(P)H-dependent oxidoreductase [Marinobacterium sedimentorum]